MRLRGSLFWGIALILLAFLLLANQFHWLPGNINDYIFPAFVVLVGAWLIIRAVTSLRRVGASQTISIPLENAASARVRLDHGAGRLNVHSGAATTELLNGNFGTEVDYRSELEADRQEVRLRTSSQFWAWDPGQSLDWNIALNPAIPLDLRVESGASTTVLELTDLKVTQLKVHTGASSTEVTLPVNAGYTNVDINTGASSVKITVPASVAAHIRVKTGVTAVHVDSRFIPQGNGVYQSGEYATAVNRAEISVDAGVGSIDIR